jgi:hypothetical protein
VYLKFGTKCSIKKSETEKTIKKDNAITKFNSEIYFLLLGKYIIKTKDANKRKRTNEIELSRKFAKKSKWRHANKTVPIFD